MRTSNASDGQPRVSRSNLLALTIACPQCKAPAGYRCRDTDGVEGSGWGHTARREAFRRAHRGAIPHRRGKSGKATSDSFRIAAPSNSNKATWLPPVSPELLELSKQHEAAGFLPWEGWSCFERAASHA